MPRQHTDIVAEELGVRPSQVAATASLLADGATVPFIARYRKEATGSLDEVAIAAIRDRLEQLESLNKRRTAIIESLAERELLTDDLSARIAGAATLAELEDTYLPFRPKRRTRAMVARERGLGPLADLLLGPEDPSLDPLAAAEGFVATERGVETAEDALAGARDIIAERVAEDADTRAELRKLYSSRGLITSTVVKGHEEEGAKFRDYFEWSESGAAAPSHRVLAMLRGEDEGHLKVRIAPPEDDALEVARRRFVKGETPASAEVDAALVDGYRRLLGPSMETEMRATLKARADEEAIKVFAQNLRELLLAAPLGRKAVLAIDPGFRTGCKVVCLDAQGKLLHNDTIYPHTGEVKGREATATLLALCQRFSIDAIAIGNGTGSRETERFVRAAGLPASIQVLVVSESGASVYSASEAAREEFPEHDVTVRGAVSIGRRLMDPLAELVKIDPKAIGVGQYQHDVDQAALRQALDDTVVSCVNGVGVDLNRASRQLLTYVSGLGRRLAAHIVDYRETNGPFQQRQDLMAVPHLGPKAFEQAAGFLRIPDAENPLDRSAVHPESYGVVEAITRDLGCSLEELMASETLRRQIDPNRYVTDSVGLPTLTDIIEELGKPGRDPRDQLEAFAFAEGIEKVEDLQRGMKLPGIVTNVTHFGAFVDIGVHQDGLVHVSHLSDRFVKDPTEVVKVQQKVKVTVLDVDLARQRISLSMKSDPFAEPRRQGEAPRPSARPKTVRPASPRPKREDTSGQAGWFREAMMKANEKKRG